MSITEINSIILSFVLHAIFVVSFTLDGGCKF